eukprot:CAMPEP_0204879074 /NCGR_PEP_ID=MMETSP1349-20130617/372_1 /ASSEMBLY_ACC=CAM_ASM_000710 /TAXON_ID=215587 /ORGANISM="Aplanochytrium stocchinoi, Strain GSBS06" /LENGTH=46 /DNA_ID= /DNA_START= /DNA_END= /DNA_ORIENTATION=
MTISDVRVSENGEGNFNLMPFIFGIISCINSTTFVYSPANLDYTRG